MYLLNTYIIISPWIKGFYFLRLLIDTYVGLDIVSKIITMSVLEDLSVIVINWAMCLHPPSNISSLKNIRFTPYQPLSNSQLWVRREGGGREGWNIGTCIVINNKFLISPLNLHICVVCRSQAF